MGQGGLLPIRVNLSESDALLYATDYDYAPVRLYTGNSTQLVVSKAYVICDTFPDYTQGVAYSKDFLSALLLDSLKIRLNLNKHSTQNDTLLVSLIDTDGHKMPGTNVFYVDTLVFSASLYNGTSYASSGYLTIPVGKFPPVSYAVSFEFRGAVTDTLYLWSGYGTDGLCEGSPEGKKAQLSHFYPNSFGYWPSLLQLLPNHLGHDLFWNCDSVPGLDSIADGRSHVQNWDMEFLYTATTLSLQDNYIADKPLLFPNPNNGTFYVKAEIGIKYMEVYSVDGKLRWKGNSTGGLVSVSLPQGIYVVHVHSDIGIRVEKLIISEQ